MRTAWLNHNIPAEKILIWCSAMRIPSTFAHYSEHGGAADSCEHRFVEVIWGGIFTYQSMPGRSQTFSWLNHNSIAEKILIWRPLIDTHRGRWRLASGTRPTYIPLISVGHCRYCSVIVTGRFSGSLRGLYGAGGTSTRRIYF